MQANTNAQIEIKHWAGRVLYTHQPADSSGMTMRHALEAAVMAGANLTGANLACAHLTGANLTGAYLRGANLTCAHLTGANLTGANLACAHLTGANLTGAYLRGANLRGANLRGATIYGIKITRTPVTIDGLRWGVTIIDGHIEIGCQFHPIGAWSAFDDAAIAAMDGRDALRFWREHKAVIMALAAPFAAMPGWRGARMSNRPTPSPAMIKAMALVAGGMSQRKAAAEAGVSLAGLVKALKRERERAGAGLA